MKIRELIARLRERIKQEQRALDATFSRVEQAIIRLRTENLELRAENEDLKRVVAAQRRNAWGWSAGVVPLAEPEACGEFFHVKPADVERFIRERHDSYGNTPPLTHFAYSIGERGELRVRVLSAGGWRTQRGV